MTPGGPGKLPGNLHPLAACPCCRRRLRPLRYAARALGRQTVRQKRFQLDAGGERAATIYSPVQSAQPDKLDPEAYLRDPLERIADHPIDRVEQPLRWTIGRKVEAQREAA